MHCCYTINTSNVALRPNIREQERHPIVTLGESLTASKTQPFFEQKSIIVLIGRKGSSQFRTKNTKTTEYPANKNYQLFGISAWSGARTTRTCRNQGILSPRNNGVNLTYLNYALTMVDAVKSRHERMHATV